MQLVQLSRLCAALSVSTLALWSTSAFAGSLQISSPLTGSSNQGAVRIAASAQENVPIHLEIWDNGKKLGELMSKSVDSTSALSAGSHITTVLAVSNHGVVLDKRTVGYTVAKPQTGTGSSEGVNITSPKASSSTAGAVAIAASARESEPFHLELWDNGNKLGDVPATSVNTTSVLAAGSHTTTVMAISNGGNVLDSSNVSYTVTEKGALGAVTITSPTANATSINAVRITASANEDKPFHLEVWDNGSRLGSISAKSVNDVYVLPNGSHTLTVKALDAGGSVLSESSVSYNVAEDCTNSSSAQCNMERMSADNRQGYCSPAPQVGWLANACGSGVQGQNGQVPRNTGMTAVSEGGQIANQGNHTLNGHSMHFWETQENGWSNVLFRGQSPAQTPSLDSQWTLSEYVYLPDPTDHQAFEMDAQYTYGGVWTKFYTECAFNKQAGKGYWAVFDTETGGWIFLNGQRQGSQTPPVVPCDRSQFSQPWPGSANPSFTGWHHIAWSFLRNSDGTVTYRSVTFDGKTTQVNFRPNSRSGGYVNDSGNFSSLIQLDGVSNADRQHGTVDAYVSEMNLIHTK